MKNMKKALCMQIICQCPLDKVPLCSGSTGGQQQKTA